MYYNNGEGGVNMLTYQLYVVVPMSTDGTTDHCTEFVAERSFRVDELVRNSVSMLTHDYAKVFA